MAKKNILEQLNIQSITSLTASGSGFVGLAAKSDGLYQKINTGSDLKLATTTDLNSYSLTSHTHSYLPLGGGTLSGALTINAAISNVTSITGNKGSAGTLLSLTDGVNSNFVVSTTSLCTTIGNGGGSTDLAFKSNNTEYMRIKSGGNIGIGFASTDVLNSKLNVNGDGYITGGLNVDYGITTNKLNNYGELFQYGNVNSYGDIFINKYAPKIMLLDNDLLTVSIASEVDGKLADFGTNYSQGGARNAAYMGGYLRIDTRTEYPTSFFTVHSIPANGTDTTLFRIGTNGNTYIAGNLVVGGEISAYGAGSTGLDTAPASSTATGTTGERRFCSDAIYVCTATNTWKKSTLSTF